MGSSVSHAITFSQRAGYIRCQLFEANYESAAEQLEFLNEIQLTMGKSAEVAYLMSVLSWYYFKNGEKRIKYLKEAVDILKKFEKRQLRFIIQLTCPPKKRLIS
jgi:hypothetical protein